MSHDGGGTPRSSTRRGMRPGSADGPIEVRDDRSRAEAFG